MGSSGAVKPHHNMTQQHHVIYVPGILDDIYHIQSLLVKVWRLYGVHGHCHSMPWAGSENYQPKLQRLLDRIDEYAAQDYQVSLIGASAGASAVLNAYSERRAKISGVIYVCAKINAPETVSPKIYAANPAFKISLEQLQTTLTRLTPTDKTKLRSYYSPGDGVVPHAATVISGVAESRLPALRHGQAIVYSLTLGAPRLIRHLKQLRYPASP